MRTPKEYEQNLKEGIITEEMLSDALYSVNKRAKNWRDKKREYKEIIRHNRYYIDTYDNVGKAEANEQKMYWKKEKLLSVATPVCIHKEFAGFSRQRIYDTEKNFRKKYIEAAFAGEVCWVNSFVNRDGYDYYNDYYYEDLPRTWFFDRMRFNEPEYRYYLYYCVGAATFHAPIAEADIANHKDLQVIPISTITTQGHEKTDLLSVQFVDKVIALIESGQYKLQLSDKSCELEREAEKFDLDKKILSYKNENRNEYLYDAVDMLYEIVLKEAKSVPMPKIVSLDGANKAKIKNSFVENLLQKHPSEQYKKIYESDLPEKKERRELEKIRNIVTGVRPVIEGPQKPKCTGEELLEFAQSKNARSFEEIKSCMAELMRDDITTYRAGRSLKGVKDRYFGENKRKWICECFPEFERVEKRLNEIREENRKRREEEKAARKKGW